VAHVVFLRAANVGGKNVFRPAQLAAALTHLGTVNVGAAGTFVIREKASAAAIRRELVARLPFECHIAIRPAKEILDLIQADPFAGVRFSRDLRGWVAVLGAQPKTGLRFQWCFPNRDSGAFVSTESTAHSRSACGSADPRASFSPATPSKPHWAFPRRPDGGKPSGVSRPLSNPHDRSATVRCVARYSLHDRTAASQTSRGPQRHLRLCGLLLSVVSLAVFPISQAERRRSASTIDRSRKAWR
jgi:hypothetical protein